MMNRNDYEDFLNQDQLRAAKNFDSKHNNIQSNIDSIKSEVESLALAAARDPSAPGTTLDPIAHSGNKPSKQEHVSGLAARLYEKAKHRTVSQAKAPASGVESAARAMYSGSSGQQTASEAFLPYRMRRDKLRQQYADQPLEIDDAREPTDVQELQDVAGPGPVNHEHIRRDASAVLLELRLAANEKLILAKPDDFHAHQHKKHHSSAGENCWGNLH